MRPGTNPSSIAPHADARPGIEDAGSLRVLSLRSNNLTSVGDITKLAHLEVLDLSDNDLTGTLNLASNALAWLTLHRNDVAALRFNTPSLVYLDASSNNLTGGTPLRVRARLRFAVFCVRAGCPRCRGTHRVANRLFCVPVGFSRRP